MTLNSSSFLMPINEFSLLDYTEIDQGLNLWSEILPMIEKQIVTLTTVAQEMQECPDREKYVEALMKIAVRVNDVEDKATACIKEARTQLKKTKLVGKQNETRNDSDDEDEQMEVDQSQIDEQIEISSLTTENLEKLQNVLHKVLIKPPNPDTFQVDTDNRYTDFVECISKMQDNDEDNANIVDQVGSDKSFLEPVQNKKCKHNYEKKTILKYIADQTKSKHSVKCPSAGCNNILHEKDLINA